MNKAFLAALEEEISRLDIGQNPSELYDPIHYLLSLGGKRIRPVLCLITYSLFKSDWEKQVPAALSVEIFHNFTLMHDDIMDKAPLRRGKQTVHEKWNDNIAILSGDVMLVNAYQYLNKVKGLSLEAFQHLLGRLSRIAAEVCEGQQFDMNFESRGDVTVEEYIEMIRLKTAVLLGGAMKLGAIVGGADEKNADLLYQFGENLGVAFQLQDDILDVYGDPEKFGKQVGGDIISNKKTFLHLTAKALVQPEELPTLLGDHENTEIKVKAVTQLYNSYQVKEQANVEMEKYLDKAFQALDQIAVSEDRKNLLRQLAKQIMDRES